jgi:cytochrome c peroxidase
LALLVGALGAAARSDTVLSEQLVTPSIPPPAGNALTPAKVELGLRLWFDTRLSGNDRMACATCHDHRRGFSNGEATAAGITGARGTRNPPTIYAVASNPNLFWDGRAATLEEQALAPIVNPIEMNARLEDVIRKLEQVEYYRVKFREAFGTGVSAEGMAMALASFERALVVGRSPFERWLDGERDALGASAQRGLRIFHTKGGCLFCHEGMDMTDRAFHNLGIGALARQPDRGRFEVTRDPMDWGTFKTPTLRNIARSAPYMHDGSLRTLAEVVDFYDQGGEENPNLDPIMRRLELTKTEKADLVAFLESFTGSDNLRALVKRPGIRLPSEPLSSLGIPPDLLE